MDWNGFKGAAKPLDDIDLPTIGKLIGVGEDELHAVMDVESAGGGFDSQGRPKMLFEPHVFWRHLTGAKRAQAEREGLAYKRWGTAKYPHDSYPRMMQAMEIDEDAALQSASWGAFQIMGENYRILNYDRPQSMVIVFMADEEAHLRGMVDFCIANHLDDELRTHNWQVFARVYNGPGYKANNYDIKLSSAYRKWQGIRDTSRDRVGE